MRNCYEIVVHKPEEGRPLERIRRRWECTVSEGVKLVCLVQIQYFTFVETVKNFEVSHKQGISLPTRATINLESLKYSSSHVFIVTWTPKHRHHLLANHFVVFFG
jgi:hypothetical protein